MSDIIVFLDRKFYWPGTMIQGKVVLCLTKAKVVKTVAVRVYGETALKRPVTASNSSLAESSSSGEQKKPILDSSFKVLGEGDRGSKAVELKAGKHEMRFEYRLPAEVPGSLSLPSVGASVQYWATAELETAAAFAASKKLSAPAHFRICEPTFLKHFDVEFSEAHKEMTEKEYHSGWQVKTVTGRFTSVLELKKRYFLPGEQIFMNILLENGTPDTFEAVVNQIIQVEQYSLRKDLDQEARDVLRSVPSLLLAWHPS